MVRGLVLRGLWLEADHVVVGDGVHVAGQGVEVGARGAVDGLGAVWGAKGRFFRDPFWSDFLEGGSVL